MKDGYVHRTPDGLCLRQDVFREQVSILVSFARSLTYYRKLFPLYENVSDYNLKEFFVNTLNVHAQFAVIQLCKIFCSSGSNHVHWSKVCHAEYAKEQCPTGARLIDKIECVEYIHGQLVERSGIDAKEITNCAKRMVYFRNKYVAHTDLDFKGIVPYFDPAFDIANAYLCFLIDELPWGEGRVQENLVELKSGFEEEADCFLKVAGLI